MARLSLSLSLTLPPSAGGRDGGDRSGGETLSDEARIHEGRDMDTHYSLYIRYDSQHHILYLLQIPQDSLARAVITKKTHASSDTAGPAASLASMRPHRSASVLLEKHRAPSMPARCSKMTADSPLCQRPKAAQRANESPTKVSRTGACSEHLSFG